MLDPILFKPECPYCKDTFYYVDEHGEGKVCPYCSCPTCERLKWAHPSQGGCICEKESTAPQQEHHHEPVPERR